MVKVVAGVVTAVLALLAAGFYFEVKALGSPRVASSSGTFPRIEITSHGRRLWGQVVRADKGGEEERAVLIFHGAGENIGHWASTQRMLREQGISSMVFDYSGNGDSDGWATLSHLDQDARAAYAVYLQQFPATHQRAVMGFSLGNAPLLAALPQWNPAPSRIVLAAAFSSLRELAHYTFGTPKAVCELMPDHWNNVRAARDVQVPALVLHSQEDRSDPIWMGAAIFHAIPGSKKMATLQGFPHNAFSNPNWWTPVIAFLRE
jgi:hypothetical protein